VPFVSGERVEECDKLPVVVNIVITANAAPELVE
jgi:hypothetical protein